ncbi:MAG TPA: hypothetical protein V6D17_01980 [Candidatus Obscuribacterales bacterium]
MHRTAPILSDLLIPLCLTCERRAEEKPQKVSQQNAFSVSMQLTLCGQAHIRNHSRFSASDARLLDRLNDHHMSLWDREEAILQSADLAESVLLRAFLRRIEWKLAQCLQARIASQDRRMGEKFQASPSDLERASESLSEPAGAAVDDAGPDGDLDTDSWELPDEDWELLDVRPSPAPNDSELQHGQTVPINLKPQPSNSDRTLAKRQSTNSFGNLVRATDFPIYGSDVETLDHVPIPAILLRELAYKILNDNKRKRRQAVMSDSSNFDLSAETVVAQADLVMQRDQFNRASKSDVANFAPDCEFAELESAGEQVPELEFAELEFAGEQLHELEFAEAELAASLTRTDLESPSVRIDPALNAMGTAMSLETPTPRIKELIDTRILRNVLYKTNHKRRGSLLSCVRECREEAGSSPFACMRGALSPAV